MPGAPRPLATAGAPGRRGPLSVLALTLTMASAGPAAAEPLDCFGASGAIAASHWLEAERLLRARIGDPGCAEHDLTLRYSLAHVLDKQARFRPLRACDAAPLYAEVASRSADQVVRASAASAFPRMAEACTAARAADATRAAPVEERPPSEPDPPVLPWVMTGASVGLFAGGLVVNFVARDAVQRGLDAEERFRETGDFGDLEVRDDAYAEATGYAIGSYVLLGTGAALGGLAAWLWLTRDDPDEGEAMTWRPLVGPSGVGLGGSF